MFELKDGKFLIAMPLSGDASIIFDASDAGNVFAFTCSALDPQGVIVTSNEVLVTPTS